MSDEVQPLSVSTLKAALSQCMRSDRHRLVKRLNRLKSNATQDDLKRIAGQIEASSAMLAGRKSRTHSISYDSALPITAHVDELKSLIDEHQVIVVCGETGSGKSTQLPKICLDMGRGVDGMIAHTQPRRLAARTLSTRIAEELRSPPGSLVGYRVRFTDETGPETAIKLLTDGMLLAETASDRFLDQYDTIIIDEAHERSLNIDFLFGVLKKVLAKRSDLKLIVTSATIDPDRFSKYFDNAPVVEVSGRMYPVEVRYRPPDNQSRSGEALYASIFESVSDAIRLCGQTAQAEHRPAAAVFATGPC